MARREEFVTIPHEGRDKGKVFKLTEMFADQGERWAMRAFLAMARNGIEIPEEIATMGLAGVAALGIKAFGSMSGDDAEMLMAEMFRCVQAVPDATNTNITTPLFPESIEEILTRLYLRKRIFGLHVDFSKLAGALNLASPASQSAGSSTT